MAVVATSTPKRHGFSIESLIGRRDDSPRRQQAVVAAHAAFLPRPEDFSNPKDLVCRDRDNRLGKEVQARDLSINNRNVVNSSEASQDSRRSSHHSRKDSPPLHRDSLYSRDIMLHHARHSPPSRDKDALFRDRDFLLRDRDNSGFRDFQREKDMLRDSRGRSPYRPATASPSSTTTDDERIRERGDRASSASPVPLATSSPRLPSSGDSTAKATTPSSTSPESENRMGSWSSEDIKHLLHSAAAGQGGAFHPGGPPHPLAQHHGVSGVDSPVSLYQPLRVCNRSLSAAMSSLMPHQFPNLPFNPLIYNLQRDLAAAAATHPHHPAAAAAHPLLARYHGFMPRYPGLGPPPGLLFHPYRKPKRNRTAFSPNQLLQLEQAFEKNHYVVGQERKSLASKLALTETQVKVWFQNRRTKHKRMKAEEEQGGSGVTSGDEAGKMGDHSDGEHNAMSDHEMIPGEDDDICLSDEEEELSVTEDS